MTRVCDGSAPSSRVASASTNPRSPYYGDQTRMYSRKQWNPMEFCEPALAKDPALKVFTLSGAKLAPCTAGVINGRVGCRPRHPRAP